jgi:hypothetical protein
VNRRSGGRHSALTHSGGSSSLEIPFHRAVGVSCAGNAISSPPNYQCIGVGENGAIVSLLVGSTGVGTLTPSHGGSEVGDETTFQLTWTVPAGKVWRDLDHLDLKLTDKSGSVGLLARFYVGRTANDPSTFAVLDANGNVNGEGVAGGTIETSTFALDLAKSSFQGSGTTGPTVTIDFAVRFKEAGRCRGLGAAGFFLFCGRVLTARQ